jgi:hypothetical protein
MFADIKAIIPTAQPVSVMMDYEKGVPGYKVNSLRSRHKSRRKDWEEGLVRA